MYGELVPIGGGDPIPLRRKALLVGRRESCDVVLRFRNVSARHAELRVIDGYWYVSDRKSTNGVKVNGMTINWKSDLKDGDTITIGKHALVFKNDPGDFKDGKQVSLSDIDGTIKMGGKT